MAIVSVNRDKAEGPRNGALDQNARRRYVVVYVVVTDDVLDGPQVVGDAPGVPRLFAPYQSGNDIDLGSRVIGIRPRRRDDSLKVWDVEVEYGALTAQEGSQEKDPLQRPPTVRWSTVPYQQVATFDLFGLPVVNSAKDEFDPPILKDDSRLALTITRFEAEFQVALAFQYVDCVNDGAFFGFKEKEAKLSRVDSDLVTDNAQTVWNTTYEIHFRRTIDLVFGKSPTVMDAYGTHLSSIPPWNATVLDVGFREIKSGKKEKIILDDGSRTTQPVRLDGTGKVLRPMDGPRDQSVYISHELYAAKDFTALNLP